MLPTRPDNFYSSNIFICQKLRSVPALLNVFEWSRVQTLGATQGLSPLRSAIRQIWTRRLESTIPSASRLDHCAARPARVTASNSTSSSISRKNLAGNYNNFNANFERRANCVVFSAAFQSCCVSKRDPVVTERTTAHATQALFQKASLSRRTSRKSASVYRPTHQFFVILSSSAFLLALSFMSCWLHRIRQSRRLRKPQDQAYKGYALKRYSIWA